MNISKCLRMFATESSIHESRAFVIKVANGVIYADTSKMKILGAKSWGISMPSNIQLQAFPKEIQGVVIQEAFRTIRGQRQPALSQCQSQRRWQVVQYELR